MHASQIPRSCDRCHSLKERCRWNPGVASCERCVRTGHACKTQRPVKKPGRPPASQASLSRKRSRMPIRSGAGAACPESSPLPVSTTKPRTYSSSWQNVMVTIGDLSKLEIHLLDRLVHQRDGSKQFVLGPTFREEHRQRLVFHLFSSRQIVLDAYLAFALSMGDKMQIDASYRYAASALMTLRSFKVTDQFDSASCLLLGWQIFHFVLKLGGKEILSVCSLTLNLIKPHFGPDKTFDSAYLSFLASLVLTETAECLMTTGPPTLRMDHPAVKTHIDGCLGLSTSLLPYMYDLGTLNHALGKASQLLPSDMGHLVLDAGAAETLTALEARFRDWEPMVPDDFCRMFTSSEVAHMMSQAQFVPTSMLLIIHRLRYPYGVQDGAAAALSALIIGQVETALLITGKVPICVDLPLIVACIEIDDDLERCQTLQRLSGIGSYSSVFKRRLSAMISVICEATRREPMKYHWYHFGQLLASFPL